MKPSRSLTALAVALLASACSFTEPAPTAFSEYQHGKQDLADGNYGLALTHFNAAVARDPQNVAALNGLGIAYAKLGRDDAAKAAFEQALALDGASALTRGNYAIFLGRHDAEAANQQSKPGQRAELSPQPEQASAPVHSAAPAAPPELKHRSLFTISNGSGQSRLARRLQQYLSGRGFPVDRTANAARFDHTQSALFCHFQSRNTAEEIRRALPESVKLVVLPSNANTVELVAGTDLNDFDAKLALAAPVKGATR